MITSHTPETLRAFEANIAERFNRGEIRAPVHLHGGNEQQLLDIFQDVGPDDWVFSTWRSHYHCLLRGVPEDELRAAILAGHSITLNFPEYRIVTSAIVGGILPIALGVAWAIKRRGGKERVWCFLGDMARLSGLAEECIRYSSWNDLPVRWIVENNGKSVVTPTASAWGGPLKGEFPVNCVDVYSYDLPWPHSGAGVRVNF